MIANKVEKNTVTDISDTWWLLKLEKVKAEERRLRDKSRWKSCFHGAIPLSGPSRGLWLEEDNNIHLKRTKSTNGNMVDMANALKNKILGQR